MSAGTLRVSAGAAIDAAYIQCESAVPQAVVFVGAAQSLCKAKEQSK